MLSVSLASSELIIAILPAWRLGSPSYRWRNWGSGNSYSQGHTANKWQVCIQSCFDSGADALKPLGFVAGWEKEGGREQELSPENRLGEGNSRVEEREWATEVRVREPVIQQLLSVCVVPCIVLCIQRCIRPEAIGLILGTGTNTVFTWLNLLVKFAKVRYFAFFFKKKIFKIE